MTENNTEQKAIIIDKNQPEATLSDKDITKQERIKNWHKKQAEAGAHFEFVANKQHNAKTNREETTLTQKFDNDVKNNMQYDILLSTLYAATGSANPEYANMLFSQTINACNLTEDLSKNANTVMNALLEMAPKDSYEGMLISRLIVLHSQYMKFMSTASNSEYTETIDLSINRATKLMRVYNETLEILNRHRRKGEQRVIVQHVNVEKGGQAIVANKFNQQTQGGGNDKK